MLCGLSFPKRFQLEEMGRQLQKNTEWNQQLFDSISGTAMNEKSAAVNFWKNPHTIEIHEVGKKKANALGIYDMSGNATML